MGRHIRYQPFRTNSAPAQLDDVLATAGVLLSTQGLGTTAIGDHAKTGTTSENH